MKLLLCLVLLDLAASEPAPRPPPPHEPQRLRWLPRLTLRFTHRGASSQWAESVDDARSVPWGTTFELRLEWALDAPVAPGAPGRTTLTSENP